jgi:type I restriction enzyme R subunit
VSTRAATARVPVGRGLGARLVPRHCRRFIHLEKRRPRDEIGKPREGRREKVIFPRYHQLDAVRKLVQAARRGRGQELPRPALGGLGQEQQHRVARPPPLEPARRDDAKVFDGGGGGHRPARARPAAAEHHLPVRAQAGRRRARSTRTPSSSRRRSRRARRSSSRRSRSSRSSLEKISKLPGKRYAVIVDEAHSSQGGEHSRR